MWATGKYILVIWHMPVFYGDAVLGHAVYEYEYLFINQIEGANVYDRVRKQRKYILNIRAR
jgi:hypothetical protein